MRLNHVALYVADLEAAREFFVRYFGGVCGEMYHNVKTGFRSYFVSFGDACRLELMTRPDLDVQTGSRLRTGFIHLAFSVGSRQKVDELTRRLEADGFELVSGPRVTGDGYYESLFSAVEGNMIEITE